MYVSWIQSNILNNFPCNSAHRFSHVFLYALIYIVLYSVLYALCFIHGYFLNNYFHGILHLQQRSPAGHDWLQLIVAALNSLPPCHILLLFSFEVLNLYCFVTLDTRSVHQFLIRSCPWQFISYQNVLGLLPVTSAIRTVKIKKKLCPSCHFPFSSRLKPGHCCVSGNISSLHTSAHQDAIPSLEFLSRSKIRFQSRGALSCKKCGSQGGESCTFSISYECQYVFMCSML